MHPDLLSALVAERHRDLRAAMSAHRADRGRPRTPRLSLPRFRVSWTRTRLAAVSGRRRGGSLVIVISATRTAQSRAGAAAAGRPGDRGSLVRAL